jgi:2,3-bisphosphoglycerate-independent phosphoglycerate mutase
MGCPKLATAPGQAVAGPVVVVVMDGVGVGKGDEADAVHKARTPNLDRYKKEALSTQLAAHGRAVGMPSDDDMGNSEVGHNAIGAGRIFDQGAKLVAQAIGSGEAFKGETWPKIVNRCMQAGWLHLIGLLSDGNVHSHIDHLLAILAKADAEGVRKVAVHALLDGRDVPKTSALQYVDRLQATLDSINRNRDRKYVVGSGGGRMHITMDRYDADWPMVEQGWKYHVRGEGRGFASLRSAVETLRSETPNINDQDLPGFVIHEEGKAIAPIRDGDSVRRRQVREIRSRPAPGRVLRGHDAVRRRYSTSETLSRRATANPLHLGRVAVRSRRHTTGVQRDAEVRSRHLLLERQSQRHVRCKTRTLYRGPIPQATV